MGWLANFAPTGKCGLEPRGVHEAQDLDILLLEKRVLYSATPAPTDGDSGGPAPDEPIEGLLDAGDDPLMDAELLGALSEGEDSPPLLESQAVTDNNAPVLSGPDVALSWAWEDSGPPVGTDGMLISDIVNMDDFGVDADRADYVPFYVAGSGNDERRGIFLWKSGWDDWATNAQLALEKHGSLWIHLPYGRISGEAMPGDGRAEAAEGRDPYHGPMPEIANGMAHYLEQVARPTDDLYFYFGAPSELYQEGMTYEEYEALAFYEWGDALALADNAQVAIGLDATNAQPKSLGGIWDTLGGADGYNARLFEAVTDAGVEVILEPWVREGETWAYKYSTMSTDFFYHNQGLHLDDDPNAAHWADKSVKTGNHYRLIQNQSNIDNYHGGTWEQGIQDVLAAGETPVVATHPSKLHHHAWIESLDERIDREDLDPLLDQNSSGVALAAPTTTAAVANDNVFDSDANALMGIALVGVDESLGVWWYTTDDGDNWHQVQDVSQSSALMLAADDATRLYFQPNQNASGAISDAISFRAWDQTDGAANGSIASATTGGGSSAVSAEVGSGWLYVTPRNDAPEIMGASQQSVTEGQQLGISSLQISDVDGGGVLVELGAGAGRLSLGNTSGLTFLVGDGVSNQNLTFTGSLADANAALASLSYVSNNGFTGQDSISVRTDDQSNGGLGGARVALASFAVQVDAAPPTPPSPAPAPPSPPPAPAPPTISLPENPTNSEPPKLELPNLSQQPTAPSITDAPSVASSPRQFTPTLPDSPATDLVDESRAGRERPGFDRPPIDNPTVDSPAADRAIAERAAGDRSIAERILGDQDRPAAERSANDSSDADRGADDRAQTDRSLKERLPTDGVAYDQGKADEPGGERGKAAEARAARSLVQSARAEAAERGITGEADPRALASQRDGGEAMSDLTAEAKDREATEESDEERADEQLTATQEPAEDPSDPSEKGDAPAEKRDARLVEVEPADVESTEQVDHQDEATEGEEDGEAKPVDSPTTVVDWMVDLVASALRGL